MRGQYRAARNPSWDFAKNTLTHNKLVAEPPGSPAVSGIECSGFLLRDLFSVTIIRKPYYVLTIDPYYGNLH